MSLNLEPHMKGGGSTSDKKSRRGRPKKSKDELSEWTKKYGRRNKKVEKRRKVSNRINKYIKTHHQHQSLAEMAAATGISRQAVAQRVRRMGMKKEDVYKPKTREKSTYTINGEEYSLDGVKKNFKELIFSKNGEKYKMDVEDDQRFVRELAQYHLQNDYEYAFSEKTIQAMAEEYGLSSLEAYNKQVSKDL